MIFSELVSLIQSFNGESTFEDVASRIQEILSSNNKEDFLNIVLNIGIIPESIEHDSTAEKLFAKAADIVLAEALKRLNLNVGVFRERADCADVYGSSPIYGYSFVADAKTFRLSRTAKNQKDYKVNSLSGWRRNKNFAILVAPYFQYPKNKSQIYRDALDKNVCIFSWEHLYFMLKQNICESSTINLAFLWNVSEFISSQIRHKDSGKYENFRKADRDVFCKTIQRNWDSWILNLRECCQEIQKRSQAEVTYWQETIRNIQNYSRETAIQELIKTLKLREKIRTIQNYVSSLIHQIEN